MKKSVLFSSACLIVLLSLVFFQYATSAHTEENDVSNVNNSIPHPSAVLPDPNIPDLSWQFEKVRDPSGTEKYFDARVIPFDRQAMMQNYPNYNFGSITDAYGYPPQPNVYQRREDLRNPSDLETARAERMAFDSGPVRGQVNCRASTGITGYFVAFFEDIALDSHIGYHDPQFGIARITAACAALQEIGDLLQLPQTNLKPRILFNSAQSSVPPGALAAASTYFGYIQFGEDNGALHQYIVTHVDPRPSPGDFHAFVVTNFSGSVSWDTDSTLNPSTYSLKTTISHETFHALGFMSQLPYNVLPTDPRNSHNTFEKGFYKDQSLANPYFNPVTSLLQAPFGSPSPWYVNNSGVYRGTKNVVGATPGNIDPLFTPPTWMQGSSLSHFDVVRAPGQTFLMNPSVTTNTAYSSHQDERDVLCQLGYQVSNISQCRTATPLANNDVAIVSQPSGVGCANILVNDVSFEAGGALSVKSLSAVRTQSGDVLRYFSQTNCAGASSATPNNATRSVRLTASGAESRLLVYTVTDSVSNRISFPARILFVNADCSSDPNEYVCNGDFEKPFTAGIFGTGVQGPAGYSITGFSVFECMGNVPGPDCYVPFWRYDEGTADIFSALFNGGNPDLPYSPFTTLPLRDPTVGNSPISVNSPNGGNSIARILDYGPNHLYTETLLTKLKAPLIAGQSYRVSYDVSATALAGTLDSHFLGVSNVASAQNCLEFSGGGVFSSNYNRCETLPLQTGVPTNWTHISYLYTPQASYQTLRIYAATSAIDPNELADISYLLDNISIKPVILSCTADANSLSVSTSMPYSGDGALTYNWNAPGCRSTIYTDSGGLMYIGALSSDSGTNTNVAMSQGQTDNIVQVTLIAAGATTIKSITKNVTITGLPQLADANQCEITGLTSTPVPAGGNTTLQWTAPAGCKVYIGKWTPDPTAPNGMNSERIYPVPNSNTSEFPSSGSKSVPITGETTFDFVAVKGSHPNFVVWTRFIDVAPR